jgi:uncharacterized protein (TIGR00251 family)
MLEPPDGTIAVRVQPRARRDEIAGVRDGRLLVRVTAPPLEGRANDALRRLLARYLGVAPSRLSIASGAGSRDKVVRVAGLSSADLARRLGNRLRKAD